MPGTGLEPAGAPCVSKDLGQTIAQKYENGGDSGSADLPGALADLQRWVDLYGGLEELAPIVKAARMVLAHDGNGGAT